MLILKPHAKFQKITYTFFYLKTNLVVICPLAQSEIEKIHSERQNLTQSNLVQLYQTLTKRKRRRGTADKQIPSKDKPIKQPLAKKAKTTKA